MGDKYDPINLFIEAYNYHFWFEGEEPSATTKPNEKSTELPPMDLLEVVKEEVKEEMWLKFLLPNKLLIILPILLAQIKAGNI